MKWTDEGEWVPTIDACRLIGSPAQSNVPRRRADIIGALIVAAVPWVVAVALVVIWRR